MAEEWEVMVPIEVLHEMRDTMRARIERLEDALTRLIELDEPEGSERRRRVTLTQIIEDAREALKDEVAA